MPFTCTRRLTAPRYLRQSLPSKSGVGLIMNHCWKNKLNVGVITSAKLPSGNPAMRSPRKGTRSSGVSAPCLKTGGGALEDDVYGSLAVEAPPAWTPSRRGRNSAGPKSFRLIVSDELVNKTYAAG